MRHVSKDSLLSVVVLSRTFLGANLNTPFVKVSARACQLLEVLAQNCKACVDGEWEVNIIQDFSQKGNSF